MSARSLATAYSSSFKDLSFRNHMPEPLCISPWGATAYITGEDFAWLLQAFARCSGEFAAKARRLEATADITYIHQTFISSFHLCWTYCTYTRGSQNHLFLKPPPPNLFGWVRQKRKFRLRDMGKLDALHTHGVYRGLFSLLSLFFSLNLLFNFSFFFSGGRLKGQEGWQRFWNFGSSIKEKEKEKSCMYI